jgi:hypothetical protein
MDQIAASSNEFVRLETSTVHDLLLGQYVMINHVREMFVKIYRPVFYHLLPHSEPDNENEEEEHNSN